MAMSCTDNDLPQKLAFNNQSVDYSIYQPILADSTIFLFIPEDTYSDIKYILNKSRRWEPERFYLPDENRWGTFFSGEDELSKRNTTYMFSHHEKLISQREKKLLADMSQYIPNDSIDFTFNQWTPIAVDEPFKGFCIELSRPLYSADKQYAFLNIFLHYNDTLQPVDPTTYYEKVAVILQKDSTAQWQILDTKKWLML